MNAFLALVRKDLILFLHDRRALLVSLALPIIIGSFFGYMFDGGEKPSSAIKVALVLEDTSDLGAAIAAGLEADASLALVRMDAVQARKAVRSGERKLAIVIPAGFGEAAARAMFGPADKPQVDLLYDPSQPALRPMVKGMLTQLVMQVVASAMSGGQGVSVPFTTREEAVGGNAGRARSSGPQGYNAFAHAFAGMGVQFLLFMGIDMGATLLHARRTGVWNRLLAAPVSLSTLLLARAASSAVIAFGVLCVIFLFAVLVFGVHIASVAGFAGVALCFALVTASFGVLIAAFGKTPEVARGLALFATLLMVMLGGAWMPSFMFPAWLQQLSMAVPTSWAVEGLDAITWRGLDLDAVLPAMAAQLGFALLFALLAVWKFRRIEK